jgi:hypothetical protein
MHWLAQFVGVDSSKWAAWWGGFGSDLPEFGILFVLYRKFECHADGCRRPGLHHVVGTNFVTCRGHHPTKGNSAEQIAQAHNEAHDASRAAQAIRGAAHDAHVAAAAVNEAAHDVHLATHEAGAAAAKAEGEQQK